MLCFPGNLETANAAKPPQACGASSTSLQQYLLVGGAFLQALILHNFLS